MSRVFAVQIPTARRGGRVSHQFDLTPAKMYGKVEVVFPSEFKPFDPNPAILRAKVALKDFNATDALICIGNPVLICICFAVIVSEYSGPVRVLQWSGTEKAYIPVYVDMGLLPAPDDL